MISLSKYETVALVYDKLRAIENCTEECTRHNEWDSKTLRHELTQITKLSRRALEIIEAFEAASETVRAQEVKP